MSDDARARCPGTGIPSTTTWYRGRSGNTLPYKIDEARSDYTPPGSEGIIQCSNRPPALYKTLDCEYACALSL